MRAFRIHAHRPTADEIAADHLSENWDESYCGDCDDSEDGDCWEDDCPNRPREGWSACESMEVLAMYFLDMGRNDRLHQDIQSGRAYLVEIDGELSHDAAVDADQGEILITGAQLVAVHEFPDWFLAAMEDPSGIHSIYDL